MHAPQHTGTDHRLAESESSTPTIRPRHPGNPGAFDPDPPLPYGRQGHPGNPS